MSNITVTNLTFGYEGSYDNIFENVSFQIDTHWKLGFTGRNGRGKTTFLNLLLGKYEYSGTIKSDVKFAYFPYQVLNPSEMTLDILQGICPMAEDWEFIREISLLEVDAQVLYRPFETLSSGEQTKVLLAALFLGENQFLLIDEPTNHLDTAARETVSRYLQSKKGFILVSHDRHLLDCCVDHILSINKTGIEIMQGNFSVWMQNKQARDLYEMAENQKLKKEIQRLSAGAKRTAEWSDKVESSKYATTSSGSKIDKGYVGHKSAKMMKRAKNQENRMTAAAEEKSALLKDVESADSLKLLPLPYRKELLIHTNNLCLYYENQPVSAPVTFQICGGERIAVTGKNGCGKSTLLKRICGIPIEYSGILEVGSQLKISYVSQETSFLTGGLREYAQQYGIDESLFKAFLRKLGFERVQLEKQMQHLSGGQKKKVLIARSLCEQANLYVWDEPLNFIDVISRIQIEELILKYKPTMIFVEHDAAFQEKIATKVLKL